MNSSAIRGRVEELCEALLLAEPGAAEALKQAAASFLAIGRWAVGEGLPAVSQACESAAALLDQCEGRGGEGDLRGP